MHRHVLLVEDEPLIAMMLEDFLDALDKELAGTADSVAAALPLIESGGIEPAILDVNLRGGEKSFAIADALAQKDIPFVFATGGSGDEIADPQNLKCWLKVNGTMRQNSSTALS